MESLCGRLSARAALLEAPASKAKDLEKVAEELRRKVAGLEMQGSRVESLRSECGSLRLRVAELMATAMQTEEEHKALRTQVLALQHPQPQ